MAQIPQLSEEAILKHCGEKNFEHGMQYFKNGSLFNTRREGQTLKASCQGSYANAYRLQITFSNKAIKSGRCTCPVGAGGYCKHIAALLLAWQAKPRSFTDTLPIVQSVESLGKKDLVNALLYLVQLEPDLEVMLQAYLTSKGDPGTNSKHYQNQTDLIFQRIMNKNGTEAELADALSAILASVDKAIAEQNFQAAVAICSGVAKSIMHNLEAYQYYDNDGLVDNIVVDCVANLEVCLIGDKNDKNRRNAITALLEIYIQDMGVLGGIGIGDEVPDAILKHATDNEKQPAIKHLRESLAHSRDSWTSEQYQRFLDDLEDSL